VLGDHDLGLSESNGDVWGHGNFGHGGGAKAGRDRRPPPSCLHTIDGEDALMLSCKMLGSVAFVAATFFTVAVPATAGASEPESQAAALERLRGESSEPVTVDLEGGTVSFLRARVDVEGSDPAGRALDFLERYRTLYGLDSPREQLAVVRQVDGEGSEVVFFQQQSGERSILGAQLGIHLEGAEVVATSGAYLSELPAASPVRVTADEAVAVARSESGVDQDPVEEPELLYFDADVLMSTEEQEARGLGGESRLAWDVSLVTRRSFVDAETGRELLGYSLAHDAAPDLSIRTANSTGGGLFCGFPGATLWFDENGQVPNTSPDAEGRNAVTFANNSYDYFKNTFGRRSFDGNDQEVRLVLDVVDTRAGEVGAAGNAQYVPTCNHFVFNNNMATKDVVAHEFTHAVTRYSADLIYLNQSGALNESYSDVFGAMIDTANWTIGEGSAAGTLRSLAAPGMFGQPTNMSGFLVTTADSGGVHTNSGIPNFATFLSSQGGMNGGFVLTGMGRSKTEKLSYEVLTKWLTQSSNLLAARNATVSQAGLWASTGRHGFTAANACTVTNAWASVGLGDGDADCDGTPDASEADDDGDGVLDGADNCAKVANGNQLNSDGDATGNACDTDDDNDGVLDGADNCQVVANPGQGDADWDGIGDACDSTPNGDADYDGIDNLRDNCKWTPNPSQGDADKDGIGDACDDDWDNDGVKNAPDNCPHLANPGQADKDGDFHGDACDNAPNHYNPRQEDNDRDGTGDVADPDDDNDGVVDTTDNCQFHSNPAQEDRNGNGVGDECEDLAVYTGNELHNAFSVRDKHFERFQIIVFPCLDTCGPPGGLLGKTIHVDTELPVELRVLDGRGELVAEGLSDRPLHFNAEVGERGVGLQYRLEILPSPEFEAGWEYPFTARLGPDDPPLG
jgi:Zn-dependent metalloprotease